jgi:hypothetical protein
MSQFISAMTKTKKAPTALFKIRDFSGGLAVNYVANFADI